MLAGELPVLGEITAPSAVLIRPDGHVAWAGELPDPELPRALATWFGGHPGLEPQQLGVPPSSDRPADPTRCSVAIRTVLARRVCPSVSISAYTTLSPLPGPEDGLTQDSFTLEAGLLQRPLLGNVLDLGVRLDPMRRHGVEQVLNQQALGGRPHPLAAMLGEQGNSIS